MFQKTLRFRFPPAKNSAFHRSTAFATGLRSSGMGDFASNPGAFLTGLRSAGSLPYAAASTRARYASRASAISPSKYAATS